MKYLAAYQQIHRDQPDYGRGSGHTVQAKMREALGRAYAPASVLDYGCGRSRMAETIYPDALLKWRYDPAIPELAGPIPVPPRFELGLCTDVLEHVPEEELEALLLKLWGLADRWAFIVCCRPAGQLLPDGTNAHCTVHDPEWWLSFLRRFWRTARQCDFSTPANRPGFLTV